MKDMNQATKNIATKDDTYSTYQNSAYYYINNTHSHESAYQYESNSSHAIAVPSRGDVYDKEQMKIMWKKERNRLAAKKSRDKRAIQIRDLELRDRQMAENIKIYKECVRDYDNILFELFGYLEYILDRNRDENRDDFILLFDCMCKLKKSGKEPYLYLVEASDLVENPLRVTNERIDSLTCRIRESLREFLSKKSTI